MRLILVFTHNLITAVYSIIMKPMLEREQPPGGSTWAVIPYYYTPGGTSHWNETSREKSIRTLQTVCNGLRDPGFGLSANNIKVAVVDDGSSLDPSQISTDTIISLPENRGKAEAVRFALRKILEKEDAPDWIVQIDGDGDQNPNDIHSLLFEAQRLSEYSPNTPVLGIGNRYTGELISHPSTFHPFYHAWHETSGQMHELMSQHKAAGIDEPDDNLRELMEKEFHLRHEAAQDPFEVVKYRLSMLVLQRALSIKLAQCLQRKQLSWEPNNADEHWKIPDWASGSRVYNRQFAQHFLNQSRSEKYGIEAEQIIIAYLTDTNVFSQGIYFSRHRDEDTEAEKLMQMLHAILLHKQELLDQGAGQVVDFLEEIGANYMSGKSEFSMSLEPLGHEVEMVFRRNGDRITTELPYFGFVDRIYKGGLEYPWDLLTDGHPR